MSRWKQEPSRLNMEQAPGCDLCGKHHDMLLKRLNTWMCVRCAGPAVRDIVEVAPGWTQTPHPSRVTG